MDWNHYVTFILLCAQVTPFVGVWIETLDLLICLVKKYVTPFVGVWIETKECGQHLHGHNRHTLRGCVDWNSLIAGFKAARSSVTPFVGVWIETISLTKRFTPVSVTPFVGVWIETFLFLSYLRNITSHPSWVCGLKHATHLISCHYWCHTLRGCVDWNDSDELARDLERCHTLRGCVDWNLSHCAWLLTR